MSAALSRLVLSLYGLARVVCVALPLTAQAESGDEPIPPLRPPKAELPPGWWDQNGFWMLAGALVLVTLALAVALIITRLRGAPAPEPLKRAHQELEPLLGKQEDGVVLTRASHAVKGYFQSAFPLPEGELTTAEFCHAIDAEPQIGPVLGTALGEFLRGCDQRKFAPATPPEPLQAARAALNLVDAGEKRRMDIARQAEEASHK